MKIRTIETLTFLVTAPYIAWETSQNSETEYYQNLEDDIKKTVKYKNCSFFIT